MSGSNVFALSNTVVSGNITEFPNYVNATSFYYGGGVVDNTGKLYTWGHDGFGETGRGASDRAPTHLSSISDPVSNVWRGTPGYTMAAKTSTDKWYMWGRNTYSGVLGNTTNTGNVTAPEDVTAKVTTYFGDQTVSANKIIKMAMGEHHAAALTAGGKVWSWGGDNTYYATGTGTNNHTVLVTPVKLTSSTYGGATSITLGGSGGWSGQSYTLDTTQGGDNQKCFEIATQGSTAGFSLNYITSTGTQNINVNLPSDNTGQPNSVYNDTTSTAGNNSVTYSVNDVIILRNHEGTERGRFTITSDMIWSLDDLSGITEIQSTYHGVAALDSSGNVWFWGGANTSMQYAYPTKLLDSSSISGIVGLRATNKGTLYAWKSDGTFYTRGFGGYGVLANGADSDQYTSWQNVTTLQGKTIKRVFGGNETMFAWTDDGVYGVGRGNNHKLANGSTSNRNIWHKSNTLSALSIKEIDFGHATGLVLTTDGRGYMWGEDASNSMANALSGNQSGAAEATSISALSLSVLLSPSLTFDNYNKLTLENFTRPTLSDVNSTNVSATKVAGGGTSPDASSINSHVVLSNGDKAYHYNYTNDTNHVRNLFDNNTSTKAHGTSLSAGEYYEWGYEFVSSKKIGSMTFKTWTQGDTVGNISIYYYDGTTWKSVVNPSALGYDLATEPASYAELEITFSPVTATHFKIWVYAHPQSSSSNTPCISEWTLKSYKDGTLTDPNGSTYALGQTQDTIYIHQTGDYTLDVTNNDQKAIVAKNVTGTLSASSGTPLMTSFFLIRENGTDYTESSPATSVNSAWKNIFVDGNTATKYMDGHSGSGIGFAMDIHFNQTFTVNTAVFKIITNYGTYKDLSFRCGVSDSDYITVDPGGQNYDTKRTITFTFSTPITVNKLYFAVVQDGGSDLYSLLMTNGDIIINDLAYPLAAGVAESPSPVLNFDNYNKLTIANVDSDATSNIDFFSNTYEMGSRKELIINDAGTYHANIYSSNTLALVKKYANHPFPTTETQKITAGVRQTYDHFGRAVSISGDYAIVGAFTEDHDADDDDATEVNNAGSAYIFKRDGNSWVQQQKIVASDRGAGDTFGHSVSINGDYAIVGSREEDHDASGGNPLSNAGSAYIFKRDGNSWVQQQKIVASDRGAGDRFGYAVSINGDYAIVAAFTEDHDANGANALSNAGSAYIFKRSGTTWTQETKLVANDRGVEDRFGWSVSIYGDYAIVGSVYEDHDASGANELTKAGSAYIFRRDGNSWVQQQKIVANDRGEEDQFGYSVSINGDYAIVGALEEDHDANGANELIKSGSAYIFKRSGTTWVQETKLVASDREAGDYFGWSVSIDGDSAIVGAAWEEEDASGGNALTKAGSAYIFRRSGTTWAQETKIAAGVRKISDNFGRSVDISGGYAIVGARYEDEDATDGNLVNASGSAYIFERPAIGPETTLSETSIAKQFIYDENGYTDAMFSEGSETQSIRLSSDGLAMALGDGNYSSNNGRLYYYERSSISGTFTKTHTFDAVSSGLEFGASVDMNAAKTRIAISGSDADNSAANAGRVYIYDRASTSASWPSSPTATITPPASTIIRFGHTVNMSDDGLTMITSGDGTDSTANKGGVYVYEYASGSWSKTFQVAQGISRFGFKVAMNKTGTTVYCGWY